LQTALSPGESAWGGTRASGARTRQILSPKLASLGSILSTGPSAWRTPSFELYAWDQFPSILILDTISYTVQDRMFSRIAFFLEKRGFRGRILTNRELEGRHGWNAHDYGPQGLAAFFNAMSGSPVPLNPEERLLRGISVDRGLIAASEGGYSPGHGGILSVSRSSSPVERRLLLTHESFHGLFFFSAEYRSACFGLWDALSPSGRSFFLSLLGSLGYDVSDLSLTVNELQAYLLQQPTDFAEAYFTRTAKRFHAEEGDASLPGRVRELSDAARRLDRYVSAHFGFGAGGTLFGDLPRKDRP
jgi:hypothetical protein